MPAWRSLARVSFVWQRRASAFDDAAMDFCEFERGVNFRFDSGEIVFAFEQVYK